MAKVVTYLNFARETEAAFNFYQSVFGGAFTGIARFGDIPQPEGAPAIAEADLQLIMNIELPILNGIHTLMGTDAPESMGFQVQKGNNVHIMLQPDTRAEAKHLFEALSVGGEVEMELQDMFWGDYFGSFTDQYGVKWMINCSEKA